MKEFAKCIPAQVYVVLSSIIFLYDLLYGYKDFYIFVVNMIIMGLCMSIQLYVFNCNAFAWICAIIAILGFLGFIMSFSSKSKKRELDEYY